ncbi:MAG: GntR family transcriptional regulator [bacterium]|nr:GntR family transcriptional regulator [bacterium]
MIEIGKLNKLTVTGKNNYGFFLDGGDQEGVFLPGRDTPLNCEIGDILEVFIYLDSKDKIAASTRKSLGAVGQCAHLKVLSVNEIGAFLDWGMPKDLLVPFSEQMQSMKEGRSYIVYIYIDEVSNRITASSKLNKHLDKKPPEFKEGEEVEMLIFNRSDIGYKVIVNNEYWGMLYQNEVFKTVQKGERMKGYIKKIQENDKIDLMLHKPGYTKSAALTRKILAKLKQEGGFISVTDKSSPDLIYQLFGESKSTFKNAVGALYKKKLITIEKDGIRLCEK